MISFSHRGDGLSDASFDGCSIFVLPCPLTKFNEEEFASLRKFVQTGGSLFLMMCEGGEMKSHTNVNFLLEEFGIVCNQDSVVRTVFYKYFDPKEAFVSDGILNRAIPGAIGERVTSERPTTARLRTSINRPNSKRSHGASYNIIDDDNEFGNNDLSALSFVYPFGCTLSVNNDAVPVLSTGTVCYPISRPICAFHTAQNGVGRVVVVGSVHMFTDEYFSKEDNSKIFDAILKFLAEGLQLNSIDSVDPDLADFHTIPDHIMLSNGIKMCLQESEIEQAFVGDLTKLFDNSLRPIGLENWPEVIRTYERIGIKYEPLTLVSPAFQVSMPVFQAAIFPPRFRELSAPGLELFDLDDAFTSHEVQLAQLTNRCTETDLDFYIRQAGEILGINKLLFSSDGSNQQTESSSKKILESVIQHIIEWKKSNVGQEFDNAEIELLQNEGAMTPTGENDDEEEAAYFSDIAEGQYDDLIE